MNITLMLLHLVLPGKPLCSLSMTFRMSAVEYPLSFVDRFDVTFEISFAFEANESVSAWRLEAHVLRPRQLLVTT
jgi:hypothetical protein